jgi:thiamine kinase-like enzyme
MPATTQDFTAWMHLLAIPDRGHVGIVGEYTDGFIESLRNFGGRGESWARNKSTSYDGVVVNTSHSELNLPEIAGSISDGGFLCIWDANRNHESKLVKLGFDIQILTALPSLSRPRYIFDPGSGRKSVRSSIAIHPTSSLKTKIAKSLYALLAKPLANMRLVAPTILLATKSFATTSESHRTSSTWNQMRKLDPGVLHPTVIGASPGNGHKGVIAGADEDGNIRLFCKVADTRYHGEHLNNEASILSDYVREFKAAKLSVPRVIAQSADRGFTKLFLSPVTGDKLSFNRSLPDSLVRAMATLFTESLTVQQTNKTSTLMLQFIEQLIERNGNDPLVTKATLQVVEQLESKEPPLGLAHRDFVFWNVLEHNSTWAVIDWEWARERHIPFQDIFHFYVHGAVNENNLDPISAVSIINSDEGRHSLNTYAQEATLDKSLIGPMFTLYLCDWLGIQNGLGLSNAQQTNAYRQLLEAVVDGKISLT